MVYVEVRRFVSVPTATTPYVVNAVRRTAIDLKSVLFPRQPNTVAPFHPSITFLSRLRVPRCPRHPVRTNIISFRKKDIPIHPVHPAQPRHILFLTRAYPPYTARLLRPTLVCVLCPTLLFRQTLHHILQAVPLGQTTTHILYPFHRVLHVIFLAMWTDRCRTTSEFEGIINRLYRRVHLYTMTHMDLILQLILQMVQ